MGARYRPALLAHWAHSGSELRGTNRYVDPPKSFERTFIVTSSPSQGRAIAAAALGAEEVASEGRFPSSDPYAAITTSIGTPNSTGQRCA